MSKFHEKVDSNMVSFRFAVYYVVNRQMPDKPANGLAQRCRGDG